MNAIILERLAGIRAISLQYCSVTYIDRNIRLDAISLDENAFFMQAMHRLYRDVKEKNGNKFIWIALVLSTNLWLVKGTKGYMILRQESFRRSIAAGEPYKDIELLVKKALNDALKAMKVAINTEVQRVFDDVRSNLKSVGLGDEDLDPAVVVFRARVQEFVIEKTRELRGSVVAEFAKSFVPTQRTSRRRIKREREDE